MVLWEITVATAYFLGLKRTYRLALKLQRRVISPKRPKIRQFLQRRTRVAFNIALTVHKKIQERDVEVGRNFGNWIIRWLDRAKPSAQIRPPLMTPSGVNDLPKHITSGRVPGAHNQISRNMGPESRRQLLAFPWNIRPKTFPTIAMMVLPPRSASIGNQYRQLFTCEASTPENMFGRAPHSVFRKDIVQWMHLV